MRRKLYTIITLCTLLVLTACSGDSIGSTDEAGAEAVVDIRLSARAQTTDAQSSRAADANAVAGEWMKSYVIVIAQGNAITRILTKDNLGDVEQADYPAVHLEPGDYTFYSFANISLADLGLTDDATNLSSG